MLRLVIFFTEWENENGFSVRKQISLAMTIAGSAPTQQDRALRIFLCHSSGDKPFVRNIYRRLRADGFAPWLDQEDIVPGQLWEEEIPKAVRSSDAVVVFLSVKSINKEGYVQKEIKFALDIADEKPEGAIFIIPVRLEEVEVPTRLKKWQWADLFEDSQSSAHGGYQQLLRALIIRAKAIGVTVFSPEAMFDLGRKHFDLKNYDQARYWYENSADYGYPEAMNALGILHNNGLGVPRDYRRARQWQEKAAQAGSTSAMVNLGISYETGRGIPQDRVLALEWYKKAAEEGNDNARERLSRLNLTQLEQSPQHEMISESGQTISKAKHFDQTSSAHFGDNNLKFLTKSWLSVKAEWKYSIMLLVGVLGLAASSLISWHSDQQKHPSDPMAKPASDSKTAQMRPDSSQEQIPPSNGTTNSQSSPKVENELPRSLAATDQPKTPDSIKPFVVAVRAKETAWISITADGRWVWEGTLHANNERSVTANEELVLKTGDAGALDVSYNGKSLGTLGKSRQVRNLTFNREGFQ